MVALIAAIIAVVVALTSTLGLSWPWLAAIPTFIAVFLVAVILARLIVLSPMQMWKEQRDRLLAYETPVLSFYYDDANTSCKRDIPQGDGQLGQRLWRVGVKGAEGIIATGVVVRVEKMEPSMPDLPQTLHDMDGKWTGATNGWDGDGSFDILAGATKYVDVLRYQPRYSLEQSDYLGLCLQSQCPDQSIPFLTYILTLSAQGREGPPITKRFQLEINPYNLTRFYALDVSAS